MAKLLTKSNAKNFAFTASAVVVGTAIAGLAMYHYGRSVPLLKQAGDGFDGVIK